MASAGEEGMETKSASAGEEGMGTASAPPGEEDAEGMYHLVSSLHSYLCPSTHICHDTPIGAMIQHASFFCSFVEPIGANSKF